MGQNNIRTHIVEFNGTLMINAKSGVGTEVNVEFQVYLPKVLNYLLITIRPWFKIFERCNASRRN